MDSSSQDDDPAGPLTPTIGGASDEVTIHEIPERKLLWISEDYWAIWLGGVILLVALGATWLARPAELPERVAAYESLQRQLEEISASPEAKEERARLAAELEKLQKQIAPNPLASWMAKLGSWGSEPSRAFFNKQGESIVPGLLVVLLVSMLLFGVALWAMGVRQGSYPFAFMVIFALAVFSYLLAGQEVIKHYNLEYALWALVVGLLISNTVGTPQWMRPALQTELYIKTGLVLLGAEIVLHRLLALGVPGVFIAWVCTPIVLITTYLFGQHVLGIKSRSLNMVISADMSVCGVSAAIATGAACKAKKEELSLAIGLSLSFTVIMMVVMPPLIEWLNLGPVIGGAWIGGTIDSTGAVAAAGGMLGDAALETAVTVKMIQNILIGVIAFGVAVYWVTWVEPSATGIRPDIWEVWRRFPKFVLGFVGASLIFSAISASGVQGEAMVSSATATSTLLRGWFFCLAFVSIGLETNFRELARFMAGGKPLVLYVCGQGLNLALTLFMAWLMFTKVFPDASSTLGH